MKRAVLWFLCLSAAAPLAAQTRYVTDALEVPVRTGRTLENKIVRMLPAGTQVEVLGPEEEGHLRIRAARGVEGWILSRYLVDQPIARDRLAALESENVSLKAQVAEVNQALRVANAEAQDLHRAGAAMQAENTALRQEFEALRRAAARPVEVAQENERLRRELETVRSDLASAEARADALGNAAYRQWFVTGGGVALGGLILGLILPRVVARRRRSSWDRL
ncbi:MAG: TIGR04211 family SH3 domain-containing protein [Gammaproteobacteria bacterium]|nr:TIGR04211 family SH3 domain-containing protein [Gammaproteobacteria bacterium]